MTIASSITTSLTPDEPVILNADWRMDRADRQLIDAQIRGGQQHLADSLIRGQAGTWFKTLVDLNPGDVACSAPTAATEGDGVDVVRVCTLATSAHIAAAGMALGIVTSKASANSWVRVAILGVMGNAVTGLASGVAGPVRVSAAGRCEYVSALSTGDYPLGYVDGSGNLTIQCELALSAAGVAPLALDIAPVDLATTGNITLSGHQTIDSVGSTGKRVLVWQQTDATKNGIYNDNAGAWTRAADMDVSGELRPGVSFTISGGTVNGKRVAWLVTTGAVLGTTPLEFVVTDKMPANPGDDGKVQIAQAGSSAWIGGIDEQLCKWISGVAVFGALNLSAAAALTGSMPIAKLASGPEGTSLQVVAGANTWAYPAASVSSREPRITVRGKTTGNISNLAACPTTIDSVTYTGGQSIVLGSQTSPSENGVYIFGAPSGGFAALTRVTAFEASYAVGQGLHVTVREGTVGAGTTWRINSSFAVFATGGTGLSPIVLDLEDFWVIADGIDFSPAFHRCMAAMQMTEVIGTIRGVRRQQYQFLTQCLISVAVRLEGCGNFTGSGNQWKPTLGGFLVTSSPIGTSASGTQFSNITLLGPSHTAAVQHNGIESSLTVLFDNVHVGEMPGHGVVLRGKTSDDVGSLFVTTNASFTMPAAGATVSVTFVSTGPLRVGTIVRIATAGYFRVESITDGTHAVLYNFGFAYDTAYTSKNAAPGTVIATTQAGNGVLSNADHSYASALKCATVGLSGMWLEGDNTNQGNFVSLDCSSCGQRGVLGDNHGLREETFLGNNYYGFHGATNTNYVAFDVTAASFVQPLTTGRTTRSAVKSVVVQVANNAIYSVGQIIQMPNIGWYLVADLLNASLVNDGTHMHLNLLDYISNGAFPNGGDPGDTVLSGTVIAAPAYAVLVNDINSSNRSTFYGGYNENSDRSVFGSLVRVDAGRMGSLNACCITSPSGLGKMQSSPLLLSPAGEYDVIFQVGGNQGTEELLRFKTAATGPDPNGYVWRYNNAADKSWETVWNDDTSYRSDYRTTPLSARGTGYFGSARFLFGRGAYRLDGISNDAGGAKAVLNTSAVEFFGAGDMALNGDSKGPFLRRVESVISTAITWGAYGIPACEAIVALGDNSSTLQPVTDGYRFSAAAALYTADRTKTVGTTNVMKGTLVRFERRDTSRFVLTIANGGGGGGSWLMPGGAESVLVIRFDGTNWEKVNYFRSNHVALANQDFAATATLATLTGETKTITLTGVKAGDNVVHNTRAALPDGILASVWVSANDTVSVRLFNTTGGTIDCSGIRWDVKAY